MTTHDDRRTSQRPVSPSRDTPGMKADVFSVSRRIVRNGTVSVRQCPYADRRAQAEQIFCNREKQNHRRTPDARGVPATSRIFSASSSSHYWGRRRHGPARQACRMA